MKYKLIVITVLAFLGINISFLFSANWESDEITIGEDKIKLSKNVFAQYKAANPATSGGDDYQTYSAATYHAAGTKVYGVANDDPQVKYKYCDSSNKNKICSKSQPNDTLSGDSSDFSGWSTL